MRSRFLTAPLCVVALASAVFSSAETFGNTSPFETASHHLPNYVLGVQVVIPHSITLESFGLIYGFEDTNADTNAIFGLYSSAPSDGLPLTLQAVTNPVFLTSSQTYDNIAFTSTPTISAGTYWMMALYETLGNPRMAGADSGSLVAYWDNTYADGMPTNSPFNLTYTGQNFNYWVNGSAVPEPATVVMLGLGGLALLRKRR